jgi:hypothetical protein
MIKCCQATIQQKLYMIHTTCITYMSNKTNSTIGNRLQKKFKMIAVDESNYEALRDLGRMPESFNDVITKLLRRVKNNE